jgi:hypothetical protein
MIEELSRVTQKHVTFRTGFWLTIAILGPLLVILGA